MKHLEILLLEDDHLRVIAFTKRLNESGREYTLTHFEKSAEAIEALVAKKYDLILLDHDLGGRTYVDHTNDKEDCGMRVAEYFMTHPDRVRQHGPIIVHSLNGPAAQQMVELIGEAIWAPFLWQVEIWNKYLKLS